MGIGMLSGIVETARLIDNFFSKDYTWIFSYTRMMTEYRVFQTTHNFQLRAANLTIGRGGRILASALTFELAAGDALTVTGPNGAGKSTLLRTLAGLLAAVGGRISIAGGGIEPDTPAGLYMHYLGHADALKSALTVRENLAFWAAMLGAHEKTPDIAGALDTMGLPHVADFPAGYLSAGQKRRIALARLLVADRPVWLLDEPATALDAGSQDRLVGMMRSHRSRGGIIIAATHMPIGLEGAKTLSLTPESVS